MRLGSILIKRIQHRKRQYNHRQIVKTLLQRRLLDHRIRHLPRQPMNRPRHLLMLLYLSRFIRINRVPNYVQNSLTFQPVEDAIASEDDEIVEVGANSELTYFRLGDNYAVLASILSQLRFNITKRATHR